MHLILFLFLLFLHVSIATEEEATKVSSLLLFYSGDSRHCSDQGLVFSRIQALDPDHSIMAKQRCV
jgi:hypothetical protein